MGLTLADLMARAWRPGRWSRRISRADLIEVALSQGGEPKWWCISHKAEGINKVDSWHGGQCWRWWFQMAGGPCRMVEVVVIPVEEST